MLLLMITCSCKQSQVTISDANCFRQVNHKISRALKQQLGDKYQSIESQVKLIIHFYFDGNGKIDSITFVKSNLLEVGIDESNINNLLVKGDYKCLWEIYYKEKLRPDFVVVSFSPKLL